MDDEKATSLREMRLTMRVLAYWREMAKDRLFPSRGDIDPRRLGEDWPHCLLLRIEPGAPFPSFAYVGDALRTPREEPLEGRSIATCAQDTILHQATCYVPRVIAKRVPISVGGAIMLSDATLLFRSILLPLGEDGDRIDHLLGATSFREVAFTEEVHAK